MCRKTPPTNENRQIHRNYRKTTIATTTDHSTAICEDFKFIKCTTHPRGNRLRKELDSLIKKIENKEIKGSIIVVMSPDYYWNICQSHISGTSYYRMLHGTDPSKILQQRVTQFADKYKSMLTLLNRKEAQNFKIT